MGWTLHFDLRAPSFGTPAAELYAAALDMAAWADDHGATAIVLSEHHGVADGYLPSALTMAAAVAARTARTFVSVNALPLTLHDPLAVAEQAAIVQLVSGGRLALTVVPGYVDAEFAMFGIDPAERIAGFEAKLDVLVRALDGDTAVTPVTSPRPVVLVGGSSPAAARRAARLADGFAPAGHAPDLAATYRAECERLGASPGLVFMPGQPCSPAAPLFVHVADDVEAAWAVLRPHAEHELRSYQAWAAGDPGSPYAGVADADAGRAAGLWAVERPDVVAARLRAGGSVVVKPLLGGLAPDVGWSSLRLLAAAMEVPAPA